MANPDDTPPDSGPKPAPQPEGGPLNYRDGREDRPDSTRFAASVLGGMALSAAWVFASVFFWVVYNLQIHPVNPPPRLNWKAPLAITLVPLLVLGAAAFGAHRRGNRGFLIGLLIGVGAAAAVEGLCFFHR